MTVSSSNLLLCGVLSTQRHQRHLGTCWTCRHSGPPRHFWIRKPGGRAQLSVFAQVLWVILMPFSKMRTSHGWKREMQWKQQRQNKTKLTGSMLLNMATGEGPSGLHTVHTGNLFHVRFYQEVILWIRKLGSSANSPHLGNKGHFLRKRHSNAKKPPLRRSKSEESNQIQRRGNSLGFRQFRSGDS